MTTPDSHSTTETTTLAEAYAALNRNDLDGFTRCFDANVVRIEPPGFPTSGTYRGIESVRTHIAQGRGTWAEGACEPERFVVVNDRVVAFVHVLVRLKDASDWIDARIADVFTFRDGAVVQFRTFAEARDALEFATGSSEHSPR